MYKLTKIGINILFILMLIIALVFPFNKSFKSSIKGLELIGKYTSQEIKNYIQNKGVVNPGDRASEKEEFNREIAVYFNKPGDDYSPVFHGMLIIPIVGLQVWVNYRMDSAYSSQYYYMPDEDEDDDEDD